MNRYILSLDQGTTSSRAILFDREQNLVASAQREFPQLYPKEGWVEQDPMDIYASQLAVMTEAVAKSGVNVRDIAAVGIANQRETTVVWDKETGQPVYNAIVWQCRRTADIVDRLVSDGCGEMIRQKTGLVPDAYFSGPKIEWILDNVPGARQRAERGGLLFGTVDTWLLWKLTDGRVHATDRTNASRTMLYNIHTFDWDEELLRLMGIPRAMLPAVCDSSHIYGYVPVQDVLLPIAGIAGDQQSALFGQRCFEAGEAKNTYGTGCFLLMNTGHQPVTSHNGLLTTIAASLPGNVTYALEGSVFTGGAAVQWLRDELRFFDTSAESEALAVSVPDTGGVYLVPAFTGLGAPYWDMLARGVLTGLTRGTNRAHITRAALESIAYQSYDLVAAMEADTGTPLSGLSVDGGASQNSFLMQFQADILNKEVRRPRIYETTALGVCYLAGLAADVWDSTAALRAQEHGACFKPNLSEDDRSHLISGWHSAVIQCRGK